MRKSWDVLSQAVLYREYSPCEALRGSVRALFSFSEPRPDASSALPILWEVQFGPGERSCAPTFADGHASIVFGFEKRYCPDGAWRPCSASSNGVLIGPTTIPGPPSVPYRAESIGAYFRVGSVIAGAPLSDFENRVIALEDLWGLEARRLAEDLNAIQSESARIARLEAALIRRITSLRPTGTALDIPRVAAWIVSSGGRLTVERLAAAAGLSRQHFARVFHTNVGMPPKVYCQLARFQATLAHLQAGAEVEWAQVACEAGYTDQSHMIAEFRRFSGMTPEALRRDRWFHPFIERSVRRRPRRQRTSSSRGTT